MPPARVPATQSERKRLLTRQKHRGGRGGARWLEAEDRSLPGGGNTQAPAESKEEKVQSENRCGASAEGGQRCGREDARVVG